MRDWRPISNSPGTHHGERGNQRIGGICRRRRRGRRRKMSARNYKSGGKEFESLRARYSFAKASQILQKDIELRAERGHYLSNNASTQSSNTFRNSTPDFLTRRCGTWHFVRRVPVEFARLDPRGIIKLRPRSRIAQDRTGRCAARVAARLNNEIELHWKGLVEGRSNHELRR